MMHMLFNLEYERTPKPKYKRTLIGRRDNGVPIYKLDLIDTKKNFAYAEKRKRIGEEATAALGITCFG